MSARRVSASFSFPWLLLNATKYVWSFAPSWYPEANCGSCHSLDYIVMNSPFLDRQGWDGSVNKMIKVFGAPISAEDAKAIVDYLSANYGKS